MAGLTVLDFSDREILWKVAEALDDDGVTTAKALAISMGVHEDDTRNIGSRLSWMNRFGVVRKQGERKGETLWTLTPEGRAMLDGALTAQAANAFAALSESERVTVMERLALAAKTGKPVWRTMLRRQWVTTSGRKGELR